MILGPDGKAAKPSGIGLSKAMLDQIGREMVALLSSNLAFQASRRILAPNGNYARHEIEQQEIAELEKML